MARPFAINELCRKAVSVCCTQPNVVGSLPDCFLPQALFLYTLMPDAADAVCRRNVQREAGVAQLPVSCIFFANCRSRQAARVVRQASWHSCILLLAPGSTVRSFFLFLWFASHHHSLHKSAPTGQSLRTHSLVWRWRTVFYCIVQFVQLLPRLLSTGNAHAPHRPCRGLALSGNNANYKTLKEVG